MTQTEFYIPKMDCPSEEQMIRMKLDSLNGILRLEFYLKERKLIITHEGEVKPILNALNQLKLGEVSYNSLTIQDSQLTSTNNHESFHLNLNSQLQRKYLIIVFLVNLLFFVGEWVAGWIADSMGLVADSLDMLADSIVYGMALYAVGGELTRKKKIAQLAGIVQILLATFGLVEVIRRFFGLEEIPNFLTMIVVSFLALLANAYCLWLLQKSQSKEAHIQASLIFTSNDIIINSGVILAGGLVYYTQSLIPDLVVGGIVFIIVMRGAIQILSLSK